MDSNLSMLKYYKKHIFLLKYMLDKLDPTNNDFTPLLDIQKCIIERILNSERKIKKNKDVLVKLQKSLKNKGNNKLQSKDIKSKIKKVNDSINGYKYLLYIWRCFGDGITFKYISKWNLKRLLFEIDSSAIKQASGFIGGKTGIKKEWALIEKAASHKVPAVLCDITNAIRHGDICLLGSNDPYIIEVKSSNNTNKRVDRQIEAVKTINDYLEKDEGTIGGIDSMRRMGSPISEIHHNVAINNVIVTAMSGQTIKLNPEPGLFYIGIKVGLESNYDELFKGINEPIVYILNQAKTDKRWDNYYPFVLSLKTAESLYSFLNGEVFLIVILDGHEMKRMAKKMGYDLEIAMTKNEGFIFRKTIEELNEPFIGVISDHYIGRIGLEFLSLEWFFQNTKYLLADIEKNFIIQKSSEVKNKRD